MLAISIVDMVLFVSEFFCLKKLSNSTDSVCKLALMTLPLLGKHVKRLIYRRSVQIAGPTDPSEEMKWNKNHLTSFGTYRTRYERQNFQNSIVYF